MRSLMKMLMIVTGMTAALAVCGAGRATAEPIGTEQSPIDIITANVVRDPNFKPITFNYSASDSLTVKNINSGNVEGTFRGIPTAGLSTLSYDGSIYNLLQFHFHVESEHAINGHLFPMEIHFVNQKQGSTGTNDLLVVGRFIEVGPANTVLDPFFSGLAGIPNNNDTFGLTNFDIASLAPIGQPEFRYDGSLTTAPYTEGVNWNVFYGTPLYLSQPQIDEFASFFSPVPPGDARELQDLNGRIVTTQVPEIDVAGIGGAVAVLCGMLALAERRRFVGPARAIAA